MRLLSAGYISSRDVFPRSDRTTRLLKQRADYKRLSHKWVCLLGTVLDHNRYDRSSHGCSSELPCKESRNRSPAVHFCTPQGNFWLVNTPFLNVEGLTICRIKKEITQWNRLAIDRNNIFTTTQQTVFGLYIYCL